MHFGEDRCELIAGIRTHAHEGSGAERQEARISGEKIESDRGKRVDEKRDHHRLQEERIAEERDRDKRHK